MRKCEICDKPTDYIEFRLCHKCFVKSLDNMTLRNMVVGGEFHGKKWKEHIAHLWGEASAKKTDKAFDECLKSLNEKLK